jgi:hypothetical protein
MICAGVFGCFLLAGCAKTDEAANLGESIVVSGFSSEFNDFEAALDIEFSKQLMEELSYLGDDPYTGFRTAGSPAEKMAADLIEGAMIEAGLKNVTRDAAVTDAWTFAGAAIAYLDARGKRHEIKLGGYPTNISVEGFPMMLVDLGAGTAADYEGKDVNGKAALIDADAVSGWQMSFPVRQARIKGAGAVLIIASAGDEDGSALATRELRGQSDMPVFAVSAADGAALKSELRRVEGGQLAVSLTANSVITPDAVTENVWGEIPGRTEEVIYIIGNYDGFYHSMFENAAGVSAVIGIAKAMNDSGYIPQKTVRFVAHGAGEWGRAGAFFDRSAGAWKQISQVRPDWAESAFAVLNIDGSKPLFNATHFSMRAADEIYSFVSRSADQLIDKSYYDFTWRDETSPSGILTEEIGWDLLGVSYVATSAESSDEYLDVLYHSSEDSAEYSGFDDGAYEFTQMLFGKIVMDLDRELVRPVDFEYNFRNIIASYSGDGSTNSALMGALMAAAEKSALLEDEIDKLNIYYLNAPEEMKPGVEGMASGLNRALYRINRSLRNSFRKLTWNDEAAYPHYSVQYNIRTLRKAEVLLEVGDGGGALESLKTIDFGEYAAYFDKEVGEYFAALDNSGTWAEGRMSGAPCAVDAVVVSLMQKTAEGSSGFSEELKAVEALIGAESMRYREILEEEYADVTEVGVMIEQVLSDYFDIH